jgi:UDP-N-acetylmuramate--alanine ligase
MHIYFSGIGAGTGPLALLAKQAGYKVTCSDKQNHEYIEYLKKRGVVDIHVGQSRETIEKINNENKIDWFVYSSAVEKENKNHPELTYVIENNIKHSKRDELINKILEDSNQKMIAIAGTHGKTTTTAMTIWVFKQLGIPISYSLGAKLSFGDMAEFDKNAHFFVYEADEYDRNFLSFKPEISIIPGIDYDHPDVYPSREDYYHAFKQFVDQSQDVYAHKNDIIKIKASSHEVHTKEEDYKLIGKVNRQNAQLVVQALHDTSNVPLERLVEIMNIFPGVSRRFEMIKKGLYSDYAHTPDKIRGAIQAANEFNKEDVVVVYEGLHNTRQHFISKELEDLFENTKKLYIVPSYLAREDESLEMLTPDKLCNITKKPDDRKPAELDFELKKAINSHLESGDLVLCLSAGGGGSLDEWLRNEFR